MTDLSNIPRHIRRHLTKTVNATLTRIDELHQLTSDELAEAVDTYKTTQAALDPVERDVPGWIIEPLALTAATAPLALGLTPFDVQIVAAAAMAERTVIEMATGEGKTLAASLAAAAFALNERHIHVLTANEYLALRDAETTAPLYNALGITVAAIETTMTLDDRQAAYDADIVYGTASQFGFDYLNDNLASAIAAQAQTGHDVAIIDEADALLLDEARTPLIISAPVTGQDNVDEIAAWAATLTDDDVEIDEVKRIVTLTDDGLDRAEQVLGVDDLYADENLVAGCLAATQAQFLYLRDRDYIVTDLGDGPAVVIVDEATGRPQPDRRWRDGLHEAIEAKEHVEVHTPSPTVATITVPSYLSRYEHTAAMTGTASTDSDEFETRYDLVVCPIPTHRPRIRIDADDVLFETRADKFERLAQDIAERTATGQPVLVGAPTVGDADAISAALTDRNITHQVLSARQPAIEAAVIAQAGRPGAVTVATNMAGRGVDILLGGDVNKLLDAELADGLDPDQAETRRAELAETVAADRETVIAAGGLAVLATARHAARRTDDQLRGRAGRQGEPGYSCFYLSLEDELLEHFATSVALAAVRRASKRNDGSLSHPKISKMIAAAQEKIENMHRDSRKQLADEQFVVDTQREELYRHRHELLETPWEQAVSDWFERAYEAVLARPDLLIEITAEDTPIPDEFTIDDLTAGHVASLIRVPATWMSDELRNDLTEAFDSGIDTDPPLHVRLADGAFDAFAARHADMDAELLEPVLHLMLTSALDDAWRGYLQAFADLTRGIHMRSVAQLDWRQEMIRDSGEMFAEVLDRAYISMARTLLAAEIFLKTVPEEEADLSDDNDDDRTDD